MSGIVAGEKFAGIKVKGLIAAAGKSSRMGDFKPLMNINGFPMIVMTVQSMKNAGIRDITVVIGRNAREMRQVLSPLGVHLVENERYGETDMLSSVQLGLKTMTDARGVCFLPGDMPLISPLVMKKIMEKCKTLDPSTEVLIPMLREEQAHPPVFFPGAYRAILSWKGEGGMRRVFEELKKEYVSLDDPGIVMDADVKRDMKALRLHAKATRGISYDQCRVLYRELYLPQNIQRHCEAVGELAGKLAQGLIDSGECLDVELCRSGGYLHDLCRLLPHHEEAGAEYLERKGYLALAEIVRHHGQFQRIPSNPWQEWVLVCLADKLILEEQRVSFRRRYDKALRNSVIKPWILQSYQICCRLGQEYEKKTGISLDKL